MPPKIFVDGRELPNWQISSDDTQVHIMWRGFYLILDTVEAGQPGSVAFVKLKGSEGTFGAQAVKSLIAALKGTVRDAS